MDKGATATNIYGPLIFFDVLGFGSVLLGSREALLATCACLMAFGVLLLVDGARLAAVLGAARSQRRAKGGAGAGIAVVAGAAAARAGVGAEV
jgi:hypothetical protein